VRENVMFIASLAGAAILTALAVLVRPESPLWKALLWSGIAIFLACACIILFDYFKPGSKPILLVGAGLGIALLLGCGIALVADAINANLEAANISVECRQAILPQTVGPSETVYILNLFPLPPENGGGGLETRFNQSGKEWKWPTDDISSAIYLSAYRCEVTNYGTKPVFDFGMTLDLSFYEAVIPSDQTNSKTYGKLKLHRGWLVPVPKIDSSHLNAFVFYIFNGLEDMIVNVLIPKVGVARQLGDDKRHEVNLTVTQLGGELPLQLWPNLKPQK
jgi:hypothetical protein